MDYISMLGKRIADVPIDNLDYSLRYSDLGADENIEPTWVVKANDGRYEMILSLNKVVQAIFIYPVQDKLDGFEFDANNGRDFIIERIGTPSRSGEERTLPILGWMGAFDKYDYADYWIHFEYTIGQGGIKKITLMLPNLV